MYREASPASLVRGSLWMLVAGLLFSAMGMLVKLGAREFSAAELVFYRSLFGFAMILPAVLKQRGFLTLMALASVEKFAGHGGHLPAFFCNLGPAAGDRRHPELHRATVSDCTDPARFPDAPRIWVAERNHAGFYRRGFPAATGDGAGVNST